MAKVTNISDGQIHVAPKGFKPLVLNAKQSYIFETDKEYHAYRSVLRHFSQLVEYDLTPTEAIKVQSKDLAVEDKAPEVTPEVTPQQVAGPVTEPVKEEKRRGRRPKIEEQLTAPPAQTNEESPSQV